METIIKTHYKELGTNIFSQTKFFLKKFETHCENIL